MPSSEAEGDISEVARSPRESVSQADVDNMIRKKRKQREYKACYPCRSRKVKCNQQTPCQSCIDRHHPQFCTFHPPSDEQPIAKRLDNGLGHGPADPGPVLANSYALGLPSPQGSRSEPVTYSGDTVTLAKEDLDHLVTQVQTLAQTLSEMQSSMHRLTRGSTFESRSRKSQSPPPSKLRNGAPQQLIDTEHGQYHYRTEGVHTRNEHGDIIHIGANSVPALALALSKRQGEGTAVQDALGNSIMPVFGLENDHAIYPFINLWGMPSNVVIRIQDLATAIPDENECNMLFQCYRDCAQVAYPGVADIGAFEDELLQFMISRSEAMMSGNSLNGIDERFIYGKPLSFIGQLFAVLASGCQCTDLPRKQRELTSQVYVSCSMECLRITNFLGHPTVENIQTLLILGRVISNNMNAGVAWALLGLTIRLAQCLGLHKECVRTVPLSKRILRSKIWWALVWQDSLLSISYDRAGTTSSLPHTKRMPPALDPSQCSGWSYYDCMYRLCQVGLDVIRERAMPQDFEIMMEQISEHKQEMQHILAKSADHLRDPCDCKTWREQLENLALRLHMSYMTSELCRPAINPDNPITELSKELRKTCIESLASTVETFLGVQKLKPYTMESWAIIHRSLSSALLLCILREQRQNLQIKALLNDFVNWLFQWTADIDPTELSTPMKRALTALMKLNNCSAPPAMPTSSSQSTRASTIDSVVQDIPGGESKADAWRDLFDSPGGLGVSSLIGFSADESPYAVLDRIVWGQQPQDPLLQAF